MSSIQLLAKRKYIPGEDAYPQRQRVLPNDRVLQVESHGITEDEFNILCKIIRVLVLFLFQFVLRRGSDDVVLNIEKATNKDVVETLRLFDLLVVDGPFLTGR